MAAVVAASSEDQAENADMVPRHAVKRLQRELVQLQKSPNDQLKVRPSNGNLREWHFVLHNLPADTPYCAGCYHGKILFPPEYPDRPPALIMLTPSGRLEVQKRLCLSMTDFHPESWCPAWSVETILVGLLSFFVSDQETGYGSIKGTDGERRKLAVASWTFNRDHAEFPELFPEFADSFVGQGSPTAQASASTSLLQHRVQPSLLRVDREERPADEEPPPVSFYVDPPEAGALPAATQRESTQETEEDKCWICWDEKEELLIHPCSCRGTMSGVHASCVERWVAQHRQDATDGGAPRCPVCHQEYSGFERRPDVADFARHMCRSAAQHATRTLVLVLLLVAYQVAAVGTKPSVPLPLRVLLVILFSLAAAHKTIVLTVSLPIGTLEPNTRCLRRFHIGDPHVLAMHLAEAFATTTILLFWCLVGVLKPVWAVPYLLLALAPLSKVVRGLGCQLSDALKCIAHLVCIPMQIVCLVAYLIYMYPRKVFDPLDAGVHIIVAVVTVILCLACQSNVPVLVLLGVHIVFVVGGLIDLHCVHRFRWVSGIPWWFALQFVALASYIAVTLCEFPKGIGFTKDDKQQHNFVVATFAVLWLILFTGLTLTINKEMVVQHFRVWQQRHGTFTLQVAPVSGDEQSQRAAPLAAQRDEPLHLPV